MHATGNFGVKVQPQAADNPQATPPVSAACRWTSGFTALDATGQGEMLAAGDGTSGAYAAMEKINGTLQGRSGSFVLVHRALMVGGAPQEWTVAVVPGTGSGELVGISGSLTITLVDGKHHYDFSYTLPDH